MHNGRSRHIRHRYNTIRQLLSTRVILVDYVKSKDNIADPLTKGLNRKLVEKSSKGMGLKLVKEQVNTIDTQTSWLDISRSRFKGTTKL